MTVFGDGTQTRAFSYIGDVAPVIAESIDVPAAYNQVFNIGADQPCSVNELAAAVAGGMGVPPASRTRRRARGPGRLLVARQDAPRVWRASRVRPGRGPRADGHLGKRHGARSSRTFEAIEVTRNLPAAWRP